MGRTRRVLVIDDDRLLCELVRTRFELGGCEVVVAYDVSEAERVLVESRPDAILLDIGLPGIDGIFYLERLRETPQTRKIPIFAISGSAEAGRGAPAAGRQARRRSCASRSARSSCSRSSRRWCGRTATATRARATPSTPPT